MRTHPFPIKGSAFAILLAVGGCLLNGCAGVPALAAGDFESEISPAWTVTADLVGARTMPTSAFLILTWISSG
ncbi:hypothetical protein BJ997_003562 [Cryobacterium roopkundense]|uniref:Uncharacterized protein n=1 Tax=Cryobacterium roopkundense TaxID=1001240 RepID=A0A7W9E639_9MICO|nr:hypothetical protein [Cryobacterium roopkundense]